MLASFELNFIFGQAHCELNKNIRLHWRGALPVRHRAFRLSCLPYQQRFCILCLSFPRIVQHLHWIDHFPYTGGHIALSIHMLACF